MSNVEELKTSRSIEYNGVRITTIYDRELNEWMYGFNLAELTNGTMNSTVFGHAKTSHDSLERAKQRIDTYRGTDDHGPAAS